VVWLAGKLDRDFALEDLLAGQVGDGFLCLIRGLQIDKGITNGTVRAGVDGDGG
jgi:hypothetical protein